MNVWTRRAAMLIGLGALVALLCYLLVYRALWQRYDGAQGQLEARSERLDGIVAVGPQIAAASQEARERVAPWLHGSGEDAQNEAQQRLRQLISASGATLISSQVAMAPAAEEGGLAMVKLTATMGGEWPAFVRFMEALQIASPPLWVRSASFLREGSGGAGQPQGARLTLQLEAPLAPAKVVP